MSAPRMVSEREAGRELDALVAERVMGWLGVVPEHVGADGSHWFVWSGQPALPEKRIRVPHYSTEIADAWLVVEKLNGNGHPYDDWFFSLTWWGAGWNARFERNPECGIPEALGEAESAPLAICRAALAAVSDDVVSGRETA